MDENIKTSKLDNRLEINPTDYAIETFTPDFKEGQKHTIVPLKLSGNSILKGSKVLFMKKSKKRHFRLSFWFYGESLTLPCGLFRKGIYGIKELEEYLKPIVKACTNKDGHWAINPKTWKKQLDLSINQIIQMICKENFPKTKIVGTLSSNQIRTTVAFLLGYNERTQKGKFRRYL